MVQNKSTVEELGMRLESEKEGDFTKGNLGAALQREAVSKSGDLQLIGAADRSDNKNCEK